MHVEYRKKDKLLMLKIEEEIDHHSTEKIRKRDDYEIQIHIPKKVIFVKVDLVYKLFYFYYSKRLNTLFLKF